MSLTRATCSSKNGAVQYILYDSDAVEISYSDGGRLQLSPCASTFVYQQTSHQPAGQLTAASGLQQRTQFATSAFQQKVKDAIDFRNRFASRPFLCRELIEPEHIVRCDADICDVTWPACVSDCVESFVVLNDASVQLSSLSCGRYQPATVCLSPTKLTFTVRYLAKLGRTHLTTDDASANDNLTSSGTAVCVESRTSQFSSAVAASCSSPSNATTSAPRPTKTFPPDLVKLLPTDWTKCEVPSVFSASSLEYSWVAQHHSVACHPTFWTHPVRLLIEFSQSDEYHFRLAHCVTTRMSEDAETPSHHSDTVVHCYMPQSMLLRCPAPHLHSWYPATCDDFCDYFHDKVSIICTNGVIYRLLWTSESRCVEIYPSDGSVIKSLNQSKHLYIHYKFSHDSLQIEERTYSSLRPPPQSTDLPYSVTRLISMATKLLEIMSNECLDLATRNQPICYKTEVKTKAIKLVPATCVVEECIVAGVGRFTAFTNGSLRIVFDDRTCLDLNGLQWEQHIYRRLFPDLSNEEVDIHINQYTSAHCTVSTVNTCQLLLPNGHYQHVNIHQPQPCYERYVTLAMEWALWVNTPPSNRQTFYDSALHEPKRLADLQLRKIHCFSHILDRVLCPEHSGELEYQPRPVAVSSCVPAETVSSVQCLAEQALQRSAELVQDIDEYLASAAK